jgi:hypothetical protein
MTTTKDTSVSFPANHRGRTWLWNESNAWDSNVNFTITVPHTRIGTRLPHWHDVISAGGNATTPLTAVHCSYDYSRLRNCFELWNYQGNPATFCRRETEGDTFISNNQWNILYSNGFMGVGFGDVSFVDNLAKAAFYKKLKALETLFQGYIFAGELLETLRMLRKPLVGLRSLSKDFLDTLRKRKRANPKKWLNDIGSAWLEQSFGWNPLINDVKSAVSAYQRLVKPVQTYKLSASAAKSYDGTSGLNAVHKPGYQAGYDVGCAFHTTASHYIENIKIRYKGAVLARVNAPSWQNKDLFGFEPQNFIPAAWELLPWSFLADYFTNIGDILDASIVSERNLAWVNRTLIRTRTKSGYFNQIWNTSPGGSFSKNAMSGSRGYHIAKRREITRSANVGLSMPTLQFNFDLTGGQLANIDALLSQANALHPQHNPRNWHR